MNFTKLKHLHAYHTAIPYEIFPNAIFTPSNLTHTIKSIWNAQKPSF